MTFMMLLRHLVVASLGARAVGSCGVMVLVLVAGHAGLVCNWLLGRPKIFRSRSWPSSVSKVNSVR